MHPELNKKFILTVTFFFFAVASAGIALWQVSVKIANARAQTRELASVIAELQEERVRTHRVKDIFSERREDILLIRQFSVEPGRPIMFIEFLEDMAKKTGNAITLHTDDRSSSGDMLMFRLSLEGTPSSVQAYLGIVDALPYDVAVKSINYQKNEVQKHATLDITLGVSTAR